LGDWSCYLVCIGDFSFEGVNEMDETIIQKLIDFIETASPVVWEAAYRQVYVEAISNFLVFLGLVALSVICYRYFTEFRDESIRLNKILDETNGYTGGTRSKRDDANIASVFFAVCIVLFAGISVFIIGGVIGRVINPDYYAIKILAGMVGL
jgi:hypothetical protein